MSHQRGDQTSADYRTWIGREATLHQQLDAQAVRALAATLGLAPPAEGEAVPPGWQWLFFNPVVAASGLGPDGHPRRDGTGGDLLPGGLPPRRMWAGSRIHYITPLPIGAHATRTERVLRVTPKEGRSGQMVFVTMLRSLSVDGRVCVQEEQDIVFRDPAPPVQALPLTAPADQAEAAPAQWRRVLCPDPVLLFRYSALTFNAHRIHYDLPYAQEIEGYGGLVVHGPLIATLLQRFAQDCGGGVALRSFEFQCLRPSLALQTLELQAWRASESADQLELRALNAQGAVTVRARVQLSKDAV